jgi:AbrB family looped-hinge helix DNA binding protein
MRVTIDRVGRLVIPKPAREELGITGPTELELTAGDGRIELSVSDVPATVEERDGVPVIVPEAPMSAMTAEEVRDAIDRVRR